VAAHAAAQGRPVRVLELDAIRRIVTPEPSYSEDERAVLYRSLALMAALLVESGVNVIVDATANRRAYRDLARRLVSRFAEVYLRCPLETCKARERRRFGGYAPGQVYDRAEQFGAPVPGAGVPYEPPQAPELTIDTAGVDPGEAALQILGLIERLEARDRGTDREPAGRWAGPPGAPSAGRDAA